MIIDLTSFSPIRTLKTIAANNQWHKTCRNDNTCKPTFPGKTPNRLIKYKREKNADKLITVEAAKEIAIRKAFKCKKSVSLKNGWWNKEE